MNKFECALGCHNYTIPDKNNNNILICENCKKKGHYKGSNGYEAWYAYDDKWNVIHYKSSNGYEIWYGYDNKGNRIHWKNSSGYEIWLNNKGYWVDKKPKNWGYEKYDKV
jgi:YD repeat-containing protein